MKTRFLYQHPRKILLLAAVGVMAGLFFLWPRGPREPVYQGKTYTQWLKQATTLTFEGDASEANPPDAEALAALNAIGTNAVPFLLHDFTRPVSAWRQRFNAWAGAHPSIKFRFRDDRKIINAAEVGLMLLGTNAAPALPVVERYLGDPVRASAAHNIFVTAGDASVPYLCMAAGATNIHRATTAILGLRMFIHRNGAARQAVLLSLQHPSEHVRAMAVTSLGYAMSSDESLVKEVVKAVNDPSPVVRMAAFRELSRLRPDVVPSFRFGSREALGPLRTHAPPPRAN